MKQRADLPIERTTYDRDACKIGVVHLGYGAFHRAHQAVYFDDYMQMSGDLNWGIAAVNLRKEDSAYFKEQTNSNEAYLFKTTTPDDDRTLREVRSHIQFEDWASNPKAAEELLSIKSVTAVTITITESGYYPDDNWSLNVEDPVIATEIQGGEKRSVYAFLAEALRLRIEHSGGPISILCCDNVRSNGDKLGRNFKTYLKLIGQSEVLNWVDENAAFPNSMVDRITPRATESLAREIASVSPHQANNAVHGESFTQWVIERSFAGEFPSLDQVGVEFVTDINPYEEAKIRILNGGHSSVCYLGALAGLQTFDEAMTHPELREHFDCFEKENVLPGLNLEMPFSKYDYLDKVTKRFSNSAIADDLSRICMDGWTKVPIFIRPTLNSCLAQGISPTWSYESIASWYVYARRFAQGRTHIAYVEPFWGSLAPLLEQGRETDFATHELLWSNLPEIYDEFVPELVSAISRMEKRWPI